MSMSRVELPTWESLELLRSENVGRLCVIHDSYPLAFPVNYRVAGDVTETKIVFRTIPHATMARYEGPASMEVDQVDLEHGRAWSVIARGHLHRVVGDHDQLPDPHPILSEQRHQWLQLDVTAISGRRFVSRPVGDGFVVEWQAAE